MRTFWALIRRDVRLGVRSSGGAALAAAFFALIVLLAPFGLGPEAGGLRAAAPGLFWIAALLATLLGLERMLQPDAEDGTLDLLRLSPLPLELVTVAKIVAHWLTSGFTITLLAPLLAPLLSLESKAIPVLGLSLLLGTPGLSAIGAAAAALGASAVAAAQTNQEPTQALIFLTACSLLAFVVGPIAAAAALRLNED